MKNIFTIILLISGFTQANGQGILGIESYVAPLIIIAGESNAGGIALLNSGPTAYELAPRTSMKILNNTSFLFENLDVGTNNLILHQGLTDNQSFGMEIGLANCADSGRFGSTPVYLMKAGTGSSQIWWWNDSTYLYLGANAWEQFKQRADTAIKLLTALNKIAPPLYLIWTQGVNENLNSVPVATWKADTKTFFTKLRARYGNIPIFITYLMPQYTAYNAAIAALESEVSNLHAIVTSDAGLDGTTYHWNYAGLALVATRMVDAITGFYRYHP